VLAQHPELAGDGRLSDAELRADRLDERAGGLLAVREQFEQAPTDGLAEDFEGMHAATISALTDIHCARRPMLDP